MHTKPKANLLVGGGNIYIYTHVIFVHSRWYVCIPAECHQSESGCTGLSAPWKCVPSGSERSLHTEQKQNRYIQRQKDTAPMYQFTIWTNCLCFYSAWHVKKTVKRLTQVSKLLMLQHKGPLRSTIALQQNNARGYIGVGMLVLGTGNKNKEWTSLKSQDTAGGLTSFEVEL